MDLSIRAMTPEEIKYSYSQSQQLRMQCGSIGHLRGDFGSKGYDFYTTWDDHSPRLKTEAFKSEMDEVINALRSDGYGLLKDRYAMGEFKQRYPESAFTGNYTTEYGFRADTQEHAYLLRCNPVRGDYNFYCFCYQAKWLDRNIEKARQGIRFIDPHYKELFRVPDGGKIVVTAAWGEKMERACRYIDDTHVEVGKELYHICQFAEIMEKNGASYEPVQPSPPPNEKMNRNDFNHKMTVLLSNIDLGAMKALQTYATELNRDGTCSEADFFKQMYVELSLVKKHYGNEIALQLFNLSKTNCLNPFEVRGAANLLRDGVKLEEIFQMCMDGKCDRTEAEWQESKNAMKAFETTVRSENSNASRKHKPEKKDYER